MLSIIGLEGYAQQSLEAEIINFYKDLNAGDSAAVRAYFHENAVVQHMEQDTSFSFDLDGFLGICPKFKSGLFKEEILHTEWFPGSGGYVNLVRVYFKFYYEGLYHHCGLDEFIISYDMREQTTKIEKVLSTERECYELTETNESPEKIIHSKLDDWHKAAGESNFDGYFGLMAEDFYFLGTDPTERWSKAEFADFSKPYFDAGGGWDFKVNWRNLYFSEDGKVAWFEESLDTWMEECRGSGVLQYIDGGWQLYHYNLTVLIENEKIKKFIKLRKK